MKNTYENAIKKRRSVRSFNNQPIKETDIEQVNKIINELDNPFNIPVEIKVFDAKENNLKSPVITGEDTYIITKVKPQENWEIGYGYLIEKLALLLEDLGIGTTLIGGTFNRKIFENTIKKAENEIMPLATPIGYPSSKMSDREKQMREAIKADERLPFETLFFNENFSNSLDKNENNLVIKALDLMRLAPSAVNNQPWRAVLTDNIIHFYKKIEKRLAESATWDVQNIDIGIGIANFDLYLKENGLTGEFFITESGIDIDDSLEYIISYKLNS